MAASDLSPKCSAELFGISEDGRQVDIITLADGCGSEARFINYGAAIHSILVKDKAGELRDVCLGYDTLREYETQNACLGAVVGRSAGRTANARITLSGKTYELSENRSGFHMHGGFKGFLFKVWDYSIENGKLCFSYVSPDGEEGYPGTLTAKVIYYWAAPGDLCMEYDCVSDKETLINLTNHCYFNLNGHSSGTVLEHELQLFSTIAADTDDNSTPTGSFSDISGTALDFTVPARLNERINADYAPIRKVGGIDHNFPAAKDGMQTLAVVKSEESGIRLECVSDLPDIGIYTANFLSERRGKGGCTYRSFQGICLETQFVPNSVNLPAVSRRPIFAAGERYNFSTHFIFSCE